ncbi:832_t:CDS:2 [Diversispora eburnea]|uniref:832_t:CDS:1 n=1 Tax=Diversispora eburnea TaxID=1213867 RepID=A0A9N9FVM8_9GLOM|nr:832_t:CDS:2 [Diversispora eburnea]
MADSKWGRKRTGEGGRVYLFWKEELHINKLDNIEKNVSIRICNLQVQHHLSVANHILTGGNNINSLNISYKISTFKKTIDLDDDELDYEGLALLFDESNKDTLVENINEKVLEQKNDQQRNIDVSIAEAFYKYQKIILKICRVFTPTYLKILD